MMKKLCLCLLMITMGAGLGFGQSITVTSPYPGMTWCTGQTYTIRWSKTGPMNDFVKITLYDPPGINLVHIMTMNTPNDGSYDWLIPTSIPSGSYIVRVKTIDNIHWDNSEVFNISTCYAQPAITVFKPHQGETWYRNNTHTIKWSKQGTMPNQVDIHLYKKGTNIVYPIVTATGNDGTHNWPIPDSIQNGMYFIRVQTVGGAVSDDSDTFQISNFIPDLYVDTITVEPKQPTVRDDINFSALVKIVGKHIQKEAMVQMEVFGPSGVPTRIYMFRIPKYTGGGYWVKKKYKVPKYGFYTNKLTVDVNNDIDETDEGNNVKKRIYGVFPLPDLALYVTGGQRVRITKKRSVRAEVKNIGESQSPPTTLKFYLKGEGTKNYPIGRLDPGQSFTASRSHRWYTAGNKKWTIHVDPDNQIRELNKANNRKEGHVHVYAGMDFDTSGIGLKDLGVYIIRDRFVDPNKYAQITVRVKNIGSVKTPACKMRVSIQEYPTKDYDVPELIPGEKYELDMQKKWSTPGAKTITVLLDPNNQLKDSPNRNQDTKTVTVRSQ